MSDDIVKRLRDYVQYLREAGDEHALCSEAADEIERLRRVEQHWLAFEQARQDTIACRDGFAHALIQSTDGFGRTSTRCARCGWGRSSL